MAGARVVLALVLIVGCSKAKETGTAAAGSATGSAPTSAAQAAPANQGSDAGSVTSVAGSAAATGSAAAAGSAAATDSATEGFKVGDTVYGRWTDGDWYPGRIAKINDDGTYRVHYNDGDVSPSLTLKRIKPRKSAGGAATGRAPAGKSGGEACVPSHWTRCGNNCVPLMDDRYNCGRCGNVCPSNMSLCRNGVCDCTGVEKDSNGGVCPS